MIEKIAIGVILALVGVIIKLQGRDTKTHLTNICTHMQSLKAGQEQARIDGLSRVNKIRDDIKNIGVKVAEHETKIAVIETKCSMEHGDA